jgi:D-glucuronyl C5-epimerase C-terminus
MDLGYLVRSGLAIPDYWHPYLELQLQPDLSSGKVSYYPFSMDVKADYPGQLDSEGVPIVFWGPGKTASPSPVNIALYGLGSHDVFLRTGNERYHHQLLCVLRWLEQHAVSVGTGISWSYEVDMPEYRLKAPWFSGITQGLALSLFVRAHQLDPSGPWSDLAYQTWQAFHVPVEQGGFCRTVSQGVIYEEYPGPELDCVFNGVCCALIGLWEAWHTGLIPDAEVDFHNGVDGLRSYLPQFDNGNWSLYSLNSCLGKPLLASPYYVRTNGILSQVVGYLAQDPLFCRYGERWVENSRSIIRRIVMSLRIGIDRYLNAPGMLQHDKTKRSVPTPQVSNGQ